MTNKSQITKPKTLNNDKSQMPNEAQSSNYRRETVLRFRRFDLICNLDFEIWNLFIRSWVSPNDFYIIVSISNYNHLLSGI